MTGAEIIAQLNGMELQRFQWLMTCSLAAFYGVLILFGSIVYMKRKRRVEY